MRRVTLKRFWCVAAFICASIAPIDAQLASGELRIVVTDATDLPVSASGTAMPRKHTARSTLAQRARSPSIDYRTVVTT
jgi:hypothetical protein